MLSILNAMIQTATRQRRYDPPDHWLDRHRAPMSERDDRAAERLRRRRQLDRTGLR